MDFLYIIVFSILFHKMTGKHLRRNNRIMSKFTPVDMNNDSCHGIECKSKSRYPVKHVISKLRRNADFKALSGKIIEEVFITPRSPFSDSEDSIEKNVCETRQVTVFPKTARDKDSQLRYIINVKGLEQGLTYETCAEEKCFLNELLQEYHIFCKQNYILVRLLYLTEEGNFKYGLFPTPTTCTCAFSLKGN